AGDCRLQQGALDPGMPSRAGARAPAGRLRGRRSAARWERSGGASAQSADPEPALLPAPLWMPKGGLDGRSGSADAPTRRTPNGVEQRAWGMRAPEPWADQLRVW